MNNYKNWRQVQRNEEKEYRCGYCGKNVGSDRGYQRKERGDKIYICPNCSCPTFFRSGDDQVPGPSYGAEVDNLPTDIGMLYRESRECIKHSLYNASVLTARKILMHVAVDRGAGKDLSFTKYVDYLGDEGYLPPGGEGWVDRIRQKGNEANHEIPSMS